MSLTNSPLVPVVCGLAALLAVLWITRRAHPTDTRDSPYYLSVLIVGLGLGLGMVAGSFASPSETSEGAMFKVIAGLLAAFGTGFLLKYFESDVKRLPAWLKEGNGVNAVRFWAFLSVFVGASIATYVYRAYYAQESEPVKLVKELDDELGQLRLKLNRLAHAATAASTPAVIKPASAAQQ